MARDGECIKCKKVIIWDDIISDISIVNGCESRVHYCKCGHKQSMHIPRSKEKKSIWMNLKGMLGG